MKKYLIFIGSFILLHGVFQLLSGLIMTYLYAPDFTITGGTLSNTVTITQHTFYPALLPYITATIAFMIAQRFKPAKIE